MNRLITVRGLALLLLCLLYTQLDPGGAIICVASNGSFSYSKECSCDSPGQHFKHGCLACSHVSAPAVPGEDSAELPSCCADKPTESDHRSPKKECCHNFNIDILATNALQVPGPVVSDLLDQQLPASFVLIVVDPGQMRHLLDASLPPPPLHRSSSSLLLLEPIRLLL